MNTVRNYSTFHIIAWHIKMGSVLKKETDIVFKTIKPFNLHQLLLNQTIFKKIIDLMQIKY